MGKESKMEKTSDKSVTGLQPTTTHLELAAKLPTVSKKPYWDTLDVVGADRHLSSTDVSIVHDEGHPRPGFIKRRWLHFKRHWVLYTILIIVLLATLLPIIFLVVFPAIAQRLVDDADIPIHSAMIMNPTPSTVDYSLVASLAVPAGLTVDLKPITLALYTNDSSPENPYIRVTLPEYHLKGTTTVSITNQTAQILDIPQFEKFLDAAVRDEYFTLSAYGETTAYLGKLKAGVKLRKDIKLKGLQLCRGGSCPATEEDGTNLKGSLILPNPSVVTFELGNVTLNMISGGLTIGQGRVYNVVLAPGNNTVPIRGTVNIKKMIQNLPELLSSQANALGSGNVEISASGNSTICRGKHIEYYEYVLNNLLVTGQTPVMKILVDSMANLFHSGGSGSSGELGKLGDALGSPNVTEGLRDILGNLNHLSSETSSTTSAPTATLIA